MISHLKEKRLYWFAAATFLLVALPYIVPILDTADLETFGSVLVDIPPMILLILLALVRRPRNEHPVTRRFWRLIGFAFVAWLAARAAFLMVPEQQRIGDLISDFLFWGLYVCLFIAIELRPSEPKPSRFGRELRVIAIRAGIVMLAGTYLYYSLAPALLQVQEYESWMPSYLLAAILDCYLGFRFYRLIRKTPAGAWRRCYAWTAVAFTCWVLIDVLGIWCQFDPPFLQRVGLEFDLLWVIPFAPMIIAVILGRGVESFRPDPTPVEPPWRDSSVFWSSPLVGYTIAMPAIHLGLEATGVLDESLQPIRSLILLAAIIVMAGLVLQYQHRLQRETARLENEWARAIGRLRDLNQDLDQLAERRARELISTQERMLALIRAVPDTMYLLDRGGVVREVHAGSDRQTGGGKVGHMLAERLPSILHVQFKSALEAVFRTGQEQVVSCPQSVEEDQRSLELRIVSANDNEALAIVRDLTRQRRSELALQRTQKLESLGVLAGGIAHDFNNLLASILGQAQIALSDLKTDTPIRRSLVAIETGATRCAKLTTKLLAYTGKARVELAPHDLAVLLTDLRPLLLTAIGKKTSLSLDLGPDPAPIECDDTQITQVLLNLVVNADEAIGPGGGEIKIVMDRIESNSGSSVPYGLQAGSVDEPSIRVRISDSGCGMDRATQERLFDPFFTTKRSGRGLGLAAVLGIVTGHGGVIDLVSSPGEGSKFTLLFPLTKTDAETTAAADEEENLSNEWRGQGAVLIADDEPSVLQLLETFLSRLGFEAVTADNGRRAVEAFHEHRHRIRAVLLDFAMPEMNGAEAFIAIRAEDPRIPVFLFSGYTEQDAITKLADKNLTGFIHKPFDVQHVSQLLRASLAKADQAQA